MQLFPPVRLPREAVVARDKLCLPLCSDCLSFYVHPSLSPRLFPSPSALISLEHIRRDDCLILRGRDNLNERSQSRVICVNLSLNNKGLINLDRTSVGRSADVARCAILAA